MSRFVVLYCTVVVPKKKLAQTQIDSDVPARDELPGGGAILMPSIVVLLRMFQEPMYVERTEGISIKVLDKPRIKGTIRCQCGEVGEETSVGPYHRDTRRHACRHGNRPGEYCYHIAHPHCSNRQHNATHNATAWSGNAKRGYVRNNIPRKEGTPVDRMWSIVQQPWIHRDNYSIDFPWSRGLSHSVKIMWLAKLAPVVEESFTRQCASRQTFARPTVCPRPGLRTM